MGYPETHEGGDEGALHDAEARRGEGNGREHVGETVGDQEVDRRDQVTEGPHEDPEAGGVEEPVETGPGEGPPEVAPSVDEQGNPLGHLLESLGDAVGIEGGDPSRENPYPGVGAPLTPRDEVYRAEEAEEEKDSGEGREAVGRVEAVQGNGDDEHHPEQEIQHHRRAGSLSRHAEGVGVAGNVKLVKDSKGERPRGGGTPGHDVADGQSGQVDPQHVEATGGVGVEHRARQFDVGVDCRHLENDGQRHDDGIEVGQQVEGTSGGGELGNHQVLDHEDEGSEAQNDAQFAGQAKAPTTALG